MQSINSSMLSKFDFPTQPIFEPSQSINSGSKKIRKIPTTRNPSSSKEDQPKRKRTQWNRQEDAQLLELVEQFGERWTKIGQTIGGKTGKQVRDRYLHVLKQDLIKKNWTPEEDDLILSLNEQLGNNWTQIATYIPRRCANQIKNRYNWLINKPATSPEQANLNDTIQAPQGSNATFRISNLSNNIIKLEQSCKRILEMTPNLISADSYIISGRSSLDSTKDFNLPFDER